MVKFIPYTFANSTSINPYYDSRPVMSYGTRTVGVIGARRIGKTFFGKCFGLDRYLYKKIKMVWLRDNDEARKKLAINNGQKFFSDFIKNYKNIKGEIRGETITIERDGGAPETLGYLMPSSTFQNYKGNDYNEISTIVYDEFMPEQGKNYNSSRLWEFINSMYTILSTRKNARVILLSNALNRGDEILDLFGIKIKDYGIYVNREKDIAIHYCDNHPNFNKQREESIVGKWIKGTVYEENLFHNKFRDNEDLFFDQKPPKAVLFCIIKHEDINMRVYLKDDIAYISPDFNSESNSNLRFSVNYEDIGRSCRLLPKTILDGLRRAVENNRVRYANARLKNSLMAAIK